MVNMLMTHPAQTAQTPTPTGHTDWPATPGLPMGYPLKPHLVDSPTQATCRLTHPAQRSPQGHADWEAGPAKPVQSQLAH